MVKEKEKKNQIIRESFSTLSKECQLSTPKTLVHVSLNEIDLLSSDLTKFII